MWLRPLGRSGITVSALGLGTVQFGRRTGVKYPRPFALPTDAQVAALLATAQVHGVTLLDTAPAYGNSEERIGEAIAGARADWVLCTKVGEEFDGRRSRHDFSATHTLRSIERSLRRLRTDVLDIALIHADGRGVPAIRAAGAFAALRALQREGVVKAVGYSGKGLADNTAALPCADVLMCTINAEQREEAPLAAKAAAQGIGVLVKKPLASGRHPQGCIGRTALLPGVGAVVVGTLNPEHLSVHAKTLRGALGTTTNGLV